MTLSTLALAYFAPKPRKLWLLTQAASYVIASASGWCMESVCIIKCPLRTKTKGKILNEIIAIYAITNDLLKAIGHHEDGRTEMSDTEIITTALVVAIFFSGNQSAVCN